MSQAALQSSAAPERICYGRINLCRAPARRRDLRTVARWHAVYLGGGQQRRARGAQPQTTYALYLLLRTPGIPPTLRSLDDARQRQAWERRGHADVKGENNVYNPHIPIDDQMRAAEADAVDALIAAWQAQLLAQSQARVAALFGTPADDTSGHWEGADT
jgi:hypothetical protein